MTRTYHKRGELVDGYVVGSHPSYDVWSGMLSRCTNKNSPLYENYGGRGISVCERWFHFENFAKDMGIRPSFSHSLDRIDNDGNYEPGNCRWATRTEQCVNRRRFKNNKTGGTGVIKRGDNSYYARFDYEGVRYNLGLFRCKDDALKARQAFVELFLVDKSAALLALPTEPTVWSTSTTGVRGVTPHKDGGFTVRVTVKGVRRYVGYYKTFEEACDARHRFAEEATR